MGRFAPSARSRNPSVAGALTGVPEGVAGRGQELPVVAPVVQRQLEKPVAAGLAELAVGLDAAERLARSAARSHHELANAVGVGPAGAVHGGEPFVAVVVAVDDDVDTGGVERTPQRLHLGVAAVVTGTEPGV